MISEAIKSTVESLETIYAIVIALSIAEAFTQFVRDSASSPNRRGIQWDQIPSLCCMLLLVVPFYHGMSRYLFDTYQTPPRPCPYGRWLLFDFAVFTVEAILFFVLSRSLPQERWRRFFTVVAILLLVDILWGALVWSCHTDVIASWVIVNIVALAALGPALLFLRRYPRIGLTVGALIVCARTIADYWTGWNFYFPA